MKRCLQVFVVLAAAMTLTMPLLAQLTVPEIALEANANVLSMPDDIYPGEAVGAAPNPKGRVCVYPRRGRFTVTEGTSRAFEHSAARLFEFDQTGKFVKEI